MATPENNVPKYDASACAAAERAWVVGVRAGDEGAFEQIFRAYNRQLYQFALSLLDSPDEAEDVIQGVFVRIWEHRASWSVHGGLRA